MAFFSPYLFTGTISLYLGYKTYKSYYSPEFEYLVDNDIHEDSDNYEEKKGFSPSLYLDWQKNGKTIAESFLLNKKSQIYKKNIINYDWVVNAFEKVEFDGDIRYLNRLISILALEIWIKIFITHELKSNSKLS